MKISEIITDKYKLRIPHTVYYDLLADVREAEEEQEPCEDAVSREAVLDITWEEPSYTDAMNVLTEVRDKVKELPPVNPQKPKSEWEHDHEILRAYSDGANEVLDKIRAEIDEQYDRVHPYDISCAEGLEMALNIIDKYKAEGSDKE